MCSPQLVADNVHGAAYRFGALFRGHPAEIAHFDQFYFERIRAREPFEEPARRRVALGLLMGQIVQAEGLKVDRERVQSRLSELAASYPNPDEVRRAYLHSQDAMRQIESAVLEDQVVDWILERAHVTERPMSFKELTGFGQEAGGQK